jgi:hypothetical protein
VSQELAEKVNSIPEAEAVENQEVRHLEKVSRKSCCEEPLQHGKSPAEVWLLVDFLLDPFNEQWCLLLDLLGLPRRPAQQVEVEQAHGPPAAGMCTSLPHFTENDPLGPDYEPAAPREIRDPKAPEEKNRFLHLQYLSIIEQLNLQSNPSIDCECD